MNYGGNGMKQGTICEMENLSTPDCNEEMTALLKEKYNISTEDLKELKTLLRAGADPAEAVKLLKMENSIKYIPPSQELMEEEKALDQFTMVLQMFLRGKKRFTPSLRERTTIEKINQEILKDAAEIAAP